MIDRHARATFWQLRTLRLDFGPLPVLMGILNVTPDSFSDGGRYLDTAVAVERGLQLVAEGAEVLDIGGESTRPQSQPVPADEELRRVLPVVEMLAAQTQAPISVDTSKAIVAREALAAGAQIVNDVTALAGDPEMLDVVRQSGCGVVAMHMQGVPATMQQAPRYENVVAEVFGWLNARRGALIADGLDPARLALDPGIGFGKTPTHNLELLGKIERFQELGSPLVVGPSRKRFIGTVLKDDQADRTAGTVGAALALAAAGVQVLRVHSVAPVAQALQLFAACGGLAGRGAVANIPR